MTHIIVRGATWVLSAERAEGAPEAMYAMECVSCPAASDWVDNSPTPVGVWAIDHAAHSDHRHFIISTQSHCRASPVSSPDPWRSAGSGSTLAPYGAASAHGCPRTPGRLAAFIRRAVARVGSLAGPAVIAALGAVAGLCGYLLGSDSGC